MFRVFLLVVLVLGGCSAKGTGAFKVAPDGYAKSFEAAKVALHAAQFPLERVDAEQGVITTQDKASAGWGSPWDSQQSTLSQETADLLNQQLRRVRVTFDATRGAGQVEVTILRTQSPGVRVSSKTWRTVSVAVDPALTAKGIPAAYSVPTRRDSRLEARIARDIERRAAKPAK